MYVLPSIFFTLINPLNGTSTNFGIISNTYIYIYIYIRRKDRYKHFVVEILSRYISASEIEWAILISQRASLIVVVNLKKINRKI